MAHSILLQNDGKGFLLNDGKFILLNAEGPDHPQGGNGGRIKKSVGQQLVQGPLGPKPTRAITGRSIYKVLEKFGGVSKTKIKLRVEATSVHQYVYHINVLGTSLSKVQMSTRVETIGTPYKVTGESFGLYPVSVVMERVHRDNIKLAQVNHYYKVLDEIDKMYPETDDPILSFEFDEVTHNEQLIAFTHSSSFIGNVQYNTDTGEMKVILNGKTYNFCGVPQRIYDAFEGANSKGAFFARSIRTQFDC